MYLLLWHVDQHVYWVMKCSFLVFGTQLHHQHKNLPNKLWKERLSITFLTISSRQTTQQFQNQFDCRQRAQGGGHWMRNDMKRGWVFGLFVEWANIWPDKCPCPLPHIDFLVHQSNLSVVSMDGLRVNSSGRSSKWALNLMVKITRRYCDKNGLI